MWWTYILLVGSFMAAIGVGAGAFGAHALRERLTVGDLAIYETAVKYWMYHALGVCVIALVTSRVENSYMKASAISMVLGTVVFSASLVALVLTGNRSLGAVTPIGGALLILGWLLLGSGILFHRP